MTRDIVKEIQDDVFEALEPILDRYLRPENYRDPDKISRAEWLKTQLHHRGYYLGRPLAEAWQRLSVRLEMIKAVQLFIIKVLGDITHDEESKNNARERERQTNDVEPETK
jgi:hypothetical protein